jgi:uncharacterized membrane protein YphA (DoxX/SURF4 family)
MKTSFEVLFLLSMIVPPAAVVAGMAMLFGALLANRPGHVGDAAAAHSGQMALEQPVGR